MDQCAKEPKAVSRSADHRSPKDGPRRGYQRVCMRLSNPLLDGV